MTCNKWIGNDLERDTSKCFPFLGSVRFYFDNQEKKYLKMYKLLIILAFLLTGCWSMGAFHQLGACTGKEAGSGILFAIKGG